MNPQDRAAALECLAESGHPVRLTVPAGDDLGDVCWWLAE